MTLLAALSDDQMALIGCGVAVCVSFSLMTLSYVFGNARKTENSRPTLVLNSQVPDSPSSSHRKAA